MAEPNDICNTESDHTPLPPVKKGGLPLWIFRIIRNLLCLCPCDAYVVFPLIFLIIIGVLGGLSGIFQRDAAKTVTYAIIGLLAAACMGIWLRWTKSHPSVPQEHDVLSLSINDGLDSFPTAPIPPVRGELVAKNGSWFKDELGRRVLLRGINCQAGTKLPLTPEDQSATHLANTGFENYTDVSFVGRPFPLEEADFHLTRLRVMGMTCLRLLTTWEAIEHAGPKQYDVEYLEYLKAIVAKCHDNGMSVFVDFHQDVFSRWTGGDGCPGWVLEKAGFCLENLDASAAALTQQNCKGEYPKMVWNSNNFRLGAGTMWTCFFAGNDFAPCTKIDDVPIQDYLQSHFLGAMAQVAETLKDSPNVLGFDILNEPSVGFVGVKDVRDIGPNNYYVGWRVDAWSAIKMGAGETCAVNYFSSFMYLDGKRTLNTTKTCAWQNGPTSCVWYQNGVWSMDANNKPQLRKPFYFSKNPNTGKKIDFLNDYGIPFWLKAANAIRQHMPDAIIFAEPILDMTDPSKEQKPVLTDEQVGAGFVWASHYYDGMTLMTKTYSKYRGMDSVTQKPSLGMRAIQASYSKGIRVSVHEASSISNGGCPVLIGECGIPFDMGAADEKKPIFFGHLSQKSAFETNNFSTCTNALNRTMSALEDAQVSYTIWCYQPDNTNKYGDGWNGEDLSLFSKDQVVPGDEDNLFAGGRSLLAAIRPYPHRVAGDVVRFSFTLYRKDRRFQLKFEADHSLVTNETVIFLPRYQYPHGVQVNVKKGGGSYKVDWQTQTLTYAHTKSSSTNHIVVTKVLLAGKRGGEEKSSKSSVELQSATDD